MGGKVNYTLVGLFVLLLGSATVAAVLWLVARPSSVNYVTYVAHFSESVSGLNVKAAVKYRGVDVGQVRRIALDRDNPERVRILMDIEQGTPVKEDTKAILSTQGITGLAFVELTGGSRESPPLKTEPGQAYPEIKTGPSLLVRLDTAVTTALTQLGDVATSFKGISVRLEQLLGGDNQQAIAATLKHLETVTGTLAGRMDDLTGNLEAVTRNTAEASAALPKLLAEAQRTAVSVNRTAKDLNTMVTEGRGELTQISRDTLAPLGPLLVELEQLVRTLGRFSGELERNPNLLLLGRPRPSPGPGEK